VSQHSVQVFGFDQKGRHVFSAYDAAWTVDSMADALKKIVSRENRK
jgi:hypothetical protein